MLLLSIDIDTSNTVTLFELMTNINFFMIQKEYSTYFNICVIL